jgi:hypothetical protein
MPITRTAMIDDDGSGTTGTIINNAWKQELYNQIDPGVGVWTPVDVSGAGLVLTLSGARYCHVQGGLVAIFANVIYPATSNVQPAMIGGLPFPNSSFCPAGFYPCIGMANIFHVTSGGNQIYIFNPATGTQRTNAELSGAVINLAGVYRPA